MSLSVSHCDSVFDTLSCFSWCSAMTQCLAQCLQIIMLVDSEIPLTKQYVVIAKILVQS